jgi:peroxiredoxin
MAAQKTHNLLSEGSRAPAFRLARLGDGETSLEDLISRGRAVVALFKSACPICQFTFPFLERIHAAGKLPIYGVSQDGPEDTLQFSRRFGITFPMLLDTEESGYPASNAFGISHVPTVFLIEPSGAISRVIEGWSKRDIEWLGGQAGVSPIRKGEEVPEWISG